MITRKQGALEFLASKRSAMLEAYDKKMQILSQFPDDLAGFSFRDVALCGVPVVEFHGIGSWQEILKNMRKLPLMLMSRVEPSPKTWQTPFIPQQNVKPMRLTKHVISANAGRIVVRVWNSAEPFLPVYCTSRRFEGWLKLPLEVVRVSVLVPYFPYELRRSSPEDGGLGTSWTGVCLEDDFTKAFPETAIPLAGVGEKSSGDWYLYNKKGK